MVARAAPSQVATAEESKEEPVTLIVTFPLPAVALVGRILDRTGVCWVMLKALTITEARPGAPPPKSRRAKAALPWSGTLMTFVQQPR